MSRWDNSIKLSIFLISVFCTAARSHSLEADPAGGWPETPCLLSFPSSSTWHWHLCWQVLISLTNWHSLVTSLFLLASLAHLINWIGFGYPCPCGSTFAPKKSNCVSFSSRKLGRSWKPFCALWGGDQSPKKWVKQGLGHDKRLSSSNRM